jgi:glycerol uptake facilitator protein
MCHEWRLDLLDFYGENTDRKGRSMLQSMFVGELLGTMTLIIFGAGVVANTLLAKSKGQSGGWMAITTGWAMAVFIGVFVAQSTGSSQADINPAISIAKFAMGIAYPSISLLVTIIVAQVIGAFCGGVFVWLVYYPHWAATENADYKLAVFCTQPAIRRMPFNFLTEMLATLVLVLGVGAIDAINQNTAMHPGFAPYCVAMLVWGIGLSLGGPTGYAINPARDLGPRIAYAVLPIAQKRNADWGYAWVPILGPISGAIIGAMIWQVIF